MELDREKVTEALQEFSMSTSVMPSLWRVHFAPQGDTISCNVYMYFLDRKTVRARAAGQDEYAALDNCLMRADAAS